MESVRRFQMRDVPDVRQFYEPRARNRLGRLLRKLREVSQIPAKIDWRSIPSHSSVILAPNDNERWNFNIRQFVTYRLLIDHQRCQGSGKGPTRKIAAQTHPGARFHKSFRLVCRETDKIALNIFSIIVQAQVQLLLVKLFKGGWRHAQAVILKP